MTDRIKVPAPFQTSARPPIGQPMNPTGAVRRADDIAGAAITLVGFGHLVVVQGLVPTGNASC
jgi:hypothetical protein